MCSKRVYRFVLSYSSGSFAKYMHLFCDIDVHGKGMGCVAACCSVLQCFPVCGRNGGALAMARDCSGLPYVAVLGSVLQCVAVCCGVLQCVAVCRSVSQCIAVV